jgi:ABC-2 type transport system ATP-binding protein
MISTHQLRRTFRDVVALEALSITVERGTVFGLVGPDGAGKTTTMRLLTGILSPTAGTASVAGIEVTRDPESVKRRVGYMSQRFGLYPDLTVLENIHFYADIYGVPKAGRSEKIQELLGFSNLTPFADRHAGKLSGGMKQKLGLACALIHTPEVLFLDEPTNGVDPVSRRDFWNILHRLVQDGLTLFVSTAYLDEAERCHRLGLLHQGRLLAVGTPEEVKSSMTRTVWEVHSSRARDLASALRQELPEALVTLFGPNIHVAMPEDSSAGAHLTDALRKLAPECTAKRVPPSLEDVFVAKVAEEAA